MRVLLFSNDLMPFGNLPTSGGGLRSYQLYRALSAHGIEVVVSMPSFTFLVEKHRDRIPAELVENLWEFGNQDEIVRRTKPDAVLYTSNWFHVDLHLPLRVPLIVDLHGSWALETRMWNKPIDLDRKLRILAKADCLLAAGERQRKYYYGWLVQAGRVPEEDFIRYIPVSVDPQLPERKKERVVEYPHFVSGGGWFPWQNQSRTLFSICEAVRREGRGVIEIFGTPHSKEGASPEEREILHIYQRILDLQASSPQIRVSDYIGRDELISRYRGADVAVEVMAYNLERELAFTTRTIEYLSCGLPVMYNNFGEIAEHIAEFDAGWTLDPESPEEVASAVQEIFSSPEVVERKSINATRLVRERFCWDRTIAPLLEFLQAPKKAPAVEPAIGSVTPRSGFLTVHGEPVEIALSADRPSVAARFVVPADEISGIELQLTPVPSALGSFLPSTECVVRRENGSVIRHVRWSPEELCKKARHSIYFSPLRGVRGGEVLELELKISALRDTEKVKTDQPLILLQGVSRTTFPLLPGCAREGGPDWCNIALSFVSDHDSFLYRFKVLSRRALEMARRGEWRRVTRALRRRVLWVGYKIRERVLRRA